MTLAASRTTSVRACLLAFVAIFGSLSPATAQSPPSQVPPVSPSADGGTATAALADARVKRCLFLAYRRQDPALDAITTHVERSAMMFEIDGVTEGLAACRAAWAAYPTEPKVIIAHYNAMEASSVLLFGFKDMPSTDEEAAAKARALGADGGNGIFGKLVGIYLGTAYEYGIGVAADATEAARWYRKAADAGDPTGRRELERLQAKPR